MTHKPDGTNPEEPDEGHSAGGSGEVGRKLDEDAAWRSIVENYGEEPSVDLPPLDDDPPPAEPAETPRFTVFERQWKEPLESEATWHDEGHFVPPEPPPLPKMEPRRKLAWAGLLVAPLMLLVAVVFGWTYPGWLGFLLVAGFLGGFGYLVATMPRSRPGDGSGDDGAIV